MHDGLYGGDGGEMHVRVGMPVLKCESPAADRTL